MRRSSHKAKVYAVSSSAARALETPAHVPLRAQVAAMRKAHRMELDEMAERTRIERQKFVENIHREVTERIQPAVAELLAGIRAEQAEMAERSRSERSNFVKSIRAWVG